MFTFIDEDAILPFDEAAGKDAKAWFDGFYPGFMANSRTGGGNFHLFKGSSPEQQKAVVDFVTWMTTPERAAEWSIATGYVATSPAAWATEKMKAPVADFPAAAIARDQLEHAVAELSTHDISASPRL